MLLTGPGGQVHRCEQHQGAGASLARACWVVRAQERFRCLWSEGRQTGKETGAGHDRSARGLAVQRSSTWPTLEKCSGGFLEVRSDPIELYRRRESQAEGGA